jgi:hypothetical protein
MNSKYSWLGLEHAGLDHGLSQRQTGTDYPQSQQSTKWLGRDGWRSDTLRYLAYIRSSTRDRYEVCIPYHYLKVVLTTFRSKY